MVIVTFGSHFVHFLSVLFVFFKFFLCDLYGLTGWFLFKLFLSPHNQIIIVIPVVKKQGVLFKVLKVKLVAFPRNDLLIHRLGKLAGFIHLFVQDFSCLLRVINEILNMIIVDKF